VPSKGPARFGGGRTHAPQRCDGVYPTRTEALHKSGVGVNRMPRGVGLSEKQKPVGKPQDRLTQTR
jgi:hypothetical protein